MSPSRVHVRKTDACHCRAPSRACSDRPRILKPSVPNDVAYRSRTFAKRVPHCRHVETTTTFTTHACISNRCIPSAVWKWKCASIFPQMAARPRASEHGHALMVSEHERAIHHSDPGLAKPTWTGGPFRTTPGGAGHLQTGPSRSPTLEVFECRPHP